MRSVFVILFLASQFSYAGVCETEMAKFSISAEKQKKICSVYTDSPSFIEFKDCIFKTVKKFQKDATDKDIYAISEKDLSGTMNLCSGGMINNSGKSFGPSLKELKDMKSKESNAK